MDNKNKLNKYMRFLRLYLNGIFNSIDKELNPDVNIVIFNKTKDNEYMCSLLPNYHKLNNESYKISTSEDNLKNNKSILLKYIRSNFLKFDKKNQLKAFYSDSITMDSDIVFIRIIVDNNIYNKHAVLNNSLISSLVEAALFEIIDRINNNIKLLVENKDFMTLDHKETIRKAAINLMNKSLGSSSLSNVFNQINNISSLYYESSVSRGKIIILKEEYIVKNHPNMDKILMLDRKVVLKNKRLIRKLLEMCNNDISLISDGKYVYGIGRLVGDYDINREDIFTIKFNDIYSWEFIYSGKSLFRVDYEKIYLPQNKITYFEFKKRLTELFEDIDIDNITRLFSIMLEAIKQEHGTMLVISSNAKSETIRLKSQCFRVEPKRINPNIVQEITSIDGAVLIDTGCYCYGIGVILDGMATSNGDTSRGARYNSAIRYVETIKKNKEYSDCLAIVISEDGYVDIISKYTIDFLGIK